MLGTLESNCVKEKGGRLGEFQKAFVIGRRVCVVGCSWVEKWLCTIYVSMYPVFPCPRSMVRIF